MNFHFPAPPQPFVPIADSTDVFPVRRIYCVGRNYEENAREMGASGREAPFFFCKPADAVLCASAGPIAIPYPDRTADLQHEVELVVPIGALRPSIKVGELGTQRIWLDVNGRRRQDGTVSQMIWGVEETVSQLSGFFELAPGDLIFTGTPAGVGALLPGDRIEAGIDGIGAIQAQVVDKR